MPEENNARHIALKLVATIAATELAIMALFRLLSVEQWAPPLVIDLLDTLLLSVAASVMIVSWVVRPMKVFEERRRLERSLQEQKRFTEDLIDNSAVATFVLDPEHRILIWNKACQELTGVPASEMIGTDNQWKPFYPRKRQVLADIIIDGKEEDLSVLYAAYSRPPLLKNGLHSEGWFPNLNGRERYIIFDASPVRDDAKELIAVVETLQDISDRKRAEDFQRESEGTLRAITGTAPDAIVMVDDRGKITYWSPAGELILGHRAEEMIGEDLALIIPQRYREEHRKSFDRFIETGRMSSARKMYEVAALKKDGTEVPVELSISSIQIKERLYSVGIIRDISARKKLEDQLRQAQKMEAVGQLAGGIAHDFNNILSAIIGYGHLIQKHMKADDSQRMNLEHILESADRAAHLTHSLLAFSRKQLINPRPVDLNKVIQRVHTFLRRIIGEDIELKTVYKQKAVTVNADSGQLEQILMNFATNARDAMPRGGSFTIETETLRLNEAFIHAHGYGEPGTYALVSVTDTGMGMDEETRKRIFEPFFTTKETGKGTGLGLSMVYGIIKQHNGYVNVYSEPGRGTTFKIYLPAIREAAAKIASERRAPAKELLRGSETVLVAEDDAMLRKLCRIVLEEYGYRVIDAEDGEDAVRKFLAHQDTICLVVLDMIMPKKSGREAYDEIRKIRPGIKVIFMSGYTADKLMTERALEEKMELLLKPIVPDDLLIKVREVLDSCVEAGAAGQ
jgi:PAS domain S-box-containing protein